MAELAREDAPAAVEPSTRSFRGAHRRGFRAAGARDVGRRGAAQDEEGADSAFFFGTLNVTRSPRWSLHETTSRRRRRHDPTRVDVRRRHPTQEKKKMAAPATATPAIEPPDADASAPYVGHGIGHSETNSWDPYDRSNICVFYPVFCFT